MTCLSSRYERDRLVQEVDTDYVVWEETGRADYRYTATMTEVRARDELAVIIEKCQIYSCVLEGSTECEGLPRGCSCFRSRLW